MKKLIMIMMIVFGSFQMVNAQMVEYAPFEKGEQKLVDHTTGLQYLVYTIENDIGTEIWIHGQRKISENMTISGPRLLKFIPKKYGKLVNMRFADTLLIIEFSSSKKILYAWTGNSFVRIQV